MDKPCTCWRDHDTWATCACCQRDKPAPMGTMMVTITPGCGVSEGWSHTELVQGEPESDGWDVSILHWEEYPC